jgi:hypothetical protein
MSFRLPDGLLPVFRPLVEERFGNQAEELDIGFRDLLRTITMGG